MKTTKLQSVGKARKEEQQRRPRFQIVKLEERIAPCKYNPHGKKVGKCIY